MCACTHEAVHVEWDLIVVDHRATINATFHLGVAGHERRHDIVEESSQVETAKVCSEEVLQNLVAICARVRAFYA